MFRILCTLQFRYFKLHVAINCKQNCTVKITCTVQDSLSLRIVFLLLLILLEWFNLKNRDSNFVTAVVRAGNSSNYTENYQCGSSVTSAKSYGAMIEFRCNAPIRARYVSVDTTGQFMQIAEVTVKEYASKDCPTDYTITGRILLCMKRSCRSYIVLVW